MVYLYIRQKVRDDKRWKEPFDIHFSARQAAGAMQEMLVLRKVDDPCELLFLFSWCNLAKAQTFMHSVSWQMAVEQMGVIGMPTVLFLEEVG